MHRNKPLILVSLLLAAFVINLDTTIVNVALPSLVRQLHASNPQLQWVVDAYTIPLAATVLTAHAQTQPAAFPARNVPATFHGTVVDDPYRDLEDVKNPEVAAWAKSQSDYARHQLESIAGYKELRRRLGAPCQTD